MQLFFGFLARPGLAQKLLVAAVALLFFGQLTLYWTLLRWESGRKSFSKPR